jgi:hypothetical protein
MLTVDYSRAYAKNIKIILEGNAKCRLKRMSPKAYIKKTSFGHASASFSLAAVQPISRTGFLVIILRRPHIVFPSKTILIFFFFMTVKQNLHQPMGRGRDERI